MMSYKACQALGALLLVSFAVSTTGKGESCLSDELDAFVKEFEETAKCWVFDINHYLLNAKVQLMDIFTQELTKLIDSSTAKVPTNCTTAIRTTVCVLPEAVSQAACHMHNIYNLAKTYANLEECRGEPLDAPLMDLIFIFMRGVMGVLKQVHPEC